MHKLFERSFNILLLVASLAMIGSVADQYTGHKLSKAAKSYFDKHELIGRDVSGAVGEKSRGKATLILALSTHCGYCARELPQYQRLAREVQERKLEISMRALFPQPPNEALEYLKKNDLPSIDLATDSALMRNIGSTPTLLAVNKRGRVEKVWVGAGSATVEEIIAALVR